MGNTSKPPLFLRLWCYMGVGGQHQVPKAGTQYLLYRRLGGNQSRSAEVQKILPTLGFEPQTIQPVASHYTH